MYCRDYKSNLFVFFGDGAKIRGQQDQQSPSVLLYQIPVLRYGHLFKAGHYASSCDHLGVQWTCLHVDWRATTPFYSKIEFLDIYSAKT